VTVVEFPVGGDSRVYVRVDHDGTTGDGDQGLSRAGARDRVVRAVAGTWDHALAGIHAAAEGAFNQLRQINPSPDEVKVTFGVEVNSKFGATLVAVGTDAHLTVEVVWKTHQEELTAESTE
jgi:hypothetical protein